MPYSPDDLAACQDAMRGGSRSFFAASLLLPRRVAAPASALYAFCRLADDAVDHGGDAAAALAALRRRLDRAYAGEPQAHPADRALAPVLRRFAIPRALPEALLDGFAWDAEGRRYDDLPALTDYAVRVAGTVGAMMALLMGVRSLAALSRAVDLGVAMQFTNIARDVGEDARAGRLYLPQAWLREAGIDPDAFLRQPAFTPALGAVIARLLAAADELYARAESGIAALPRSCRPGIAAARLLYAEIGRQVERQGGDSVAVRAVVPRQRKARLFGRAALHAVVTSRAVAVAPLDQARFLLDAVAAVPAPPATPAWWDLDARIAWLVELFGQLDDRQRAPDASAAGLADYGG